MPRLRVRPPANTNGTAPEPELPRLMDTLEVAQYLKTTPAAVRIMLSRGELPRPILRTRRHLWRASDLARWINAAGHDQESAS
jgi:hypothetical protein